MIQGHGGNIFALAEQQGCRPEDITDMSSNINPLGTMPGLLEYLEQGLKKICFLPEVDARSAVQAMAKLLNIHEEKILAGNGTTQFIYLACQALQSRRVLIVGPTYADYADACRIQGIQPDFFLTQATEGFLPDLERLSACLEYYDTVFLCNPNNPTGQFIPPDHLLPLCRKHAQVRFLIDQSYLSFASSEETADLSHCSLANVIVLWSVSKIFGIPGLRAGFLVADPKIVASFSRFMQPWSLNTLAQEAVRFLGDNEAAAKRFIVQTQAYLADEGPLLMERLKGSGLHIYPSHTSYFLIALPDTLEAGTVCARLAEKRFVIRNCANFHGLNEHYIRIALKDKSSNAAVVTLLHSLVGT